MTEGKNQVIPPTLLQKRTEGVSIELIDFENEFDKLRKEGKFKLELASIDRKDLTEEDARMWYVVENGPFDISNPDDKELLEDYRRGIRESRNNSRIAFLSLIQGKLFLKKDVMRKNSAS